MQMLTARRLALACGLMCAFCVTSAADDKKTDGLKPIEPEKVELGRPVDFERDIYPILDANCIACHNIAIAESKFNMEEVKGILKGGKRGAAVVPGEPDKSLLYQVAARAAEPAMPPLPNDVEAAALTPRELGLLRQWILEGAQAGAGTTQHAMQWQPLPSGIHAIYAVALAPWGQLAACGRANQISIYEIGTGEEIARLKDPHLGGIENGGQLFYRHGAAHRDIVHSLAFNPDGTILASGGYRVVKLWQRPQNVRKFEVTVDEPVSAVAVSPDGRWMAVGAGSKIAVWDLQQKKRAQTLSGHAATVSSLQFTPDNARLVSAGQDKTVRIWNVADGKAVHQFETPAAVHSLVLNKDASRIVTAHADNLIRVWPADAKPAEGDESKTVAPAVEIKGHGKAVTSLALLPNGTQIVSGSEDGTVKIWELADGKPVRSMNHGGPVADVAARPDGQAVAAVGANHIARVWDLNGKQIAELKGEKESQRRVAVMNESVTVAKQIVALKEAALKAAEKISADRAEGVKKAQEAKEAADKALAEDQAKEKETDAKVAAAKEELAKKPDDKDLKKKVEEAEKSAAAQKEAVKKATDGQAAAVRSLEIAQKAVKRAEGSQADAKAALEGANAHQKQVEAELAKAQKEQSEAEKPLRSVAFTPDGKRLITAGDSRQVHVWSATTGKPIETLSGHAGVVVALACGPDNTIISGAGDKQVVVWEKNPEWKLIAQLGAKSDDPLDLSASPFENRVLALDFSADGKFLATGGGDPSRSGELMIWDVEKHSLVRKFEDAHSDTVFGVEFSRDGKYLLSGAADKFVKMFDVATGAYVKSFEGHTHHVLDVSWKADGSEIASAGADNAIKIWNVETGEQKRTISNYSKQVTSIQYMGVGENILSCGGDKTVRFHKTSNGSNYRNFGGGTDYMYSAAASRDESLVVAGGEDGVLRVWNGADGKALYSFEPPKPDEGNVQASAGK